MCINAYSIHFRNIRANNKALLLFIRLFLRQLKLVEVQLLSGSAVVYLDEVVAPVAEVEACICPSRSR